MSLLKELHDIMLEQECEECGCEIVYVDENGEVIEEATGGASVQAWRRTGGKVKRQFRCTMGEKKGRLVANPKTCIQRKNPKRMLVGKKVAQAKKGIRLRKSAITRGQAQHKMMRKMNKRRKQSGVRRTK